MSERRQVSVKGTTYQKIKDYAKEHGVSISTVVEQAVAPTLGQDPPDPRLSRRYRGPRDGSTKDPK